MRHRFLNLVILCSFLFFLLRLGSESAPDHNAIGGAITDLSGAVVAGAKLQLRTLHPAKQEFRFPTSTDDTNSHRWPMASTRSP